MAKEKAKVNISLDDSLFSIENDEVKGHSRIFSYGKPYVGELDIVVSDLGAYILSIDCPYSEDMIEMDMHLQEPEELQLTEKEFAHFYPTSEDNYCGTFQIAFSEKEMDIVLSNEITPNNYSKNDRVEYYYKDDELIYIRVKDLTEEEYNKLKSQKKNDLTEIDINGIIKDIEEKEQIKIIHATLIGSRGWGYDDKNSDIDIRFIYIRKPEDYIRIDKKENNISYPINNKEDVLGYDLERALYLICQQNPTMYEIINSDNIVAENSIIKKLKDFSEEILNVDKISFIYKRLIDERIELLKSGKSDSIKIYIYIIRMLGIINYLQEKNSFPTCNKESVFSTENNRELKQYFDRLIELKHQGVSKVKYSDQIINVVNSYLEKYQLDAFKENDNNSLKNKEKANSLLFDSIINDKEETNKTR